MGSGKLITNRKTSETIGEKFNQLHVVLYVGYSAISSNYVHMKIEIKMLSYNENRKIEEADR